MFRPSIIISLLSALVLLLSTACARPLNKERVLVIGDDFAAAKNGWVYYFQQLRKGGPLVNTANVGATTAFPSPLQPRLNTLDQLTPSLRKGFAQMGAIDQVVIQLGTNDCKARYQAGDVERFEDFKTLINRLNAFFKERGQPQPRIVLMSPPMMANEVANTDFENAQVCVRELAEDVKQFAEKEGLCYVDLMNDTDLSHYLDTDGIHYTSQGLKLMAELLKSACY